MNNVHTVSEVSHFCIVNISEFLYMQIIDIYPSGALCNDSILILTFIGN